jgi:hypothetical protein
MARKNGCALFDLDLRHLMQPDMYKGLERQMMRHGQKVNTAKNQENKIDTDVEIN